MNNKEKIKEEEILRCWICKRTEEESLREFKQMILEDDNESRVFGPIIPQKIKDIIRKDEIFPYPNGLQWEQSNIILFERGWNSHTKADIKFDSEHNMFIDIYLCDVCQSLLNDIWESLKEFMYDRLRDKGINLE